MVIEITDRFMVFRFIGTQEDVMYVCIDYKFNCLNNIG